MGVVIEESDETMFWLELINEKKWLDEEIIRSIWKEGNELTAIFVSSVKTAKLTLQKS